MECKKFSTLPIAKSVSILYNIIMNLSPEIYNMRSSRKIQWIIIIANNVGKLKEFYIEKLGFRLVREVPEDDFVQMQIGGQFFALFGKKNVEKILGAKYVTSDFKKGKTIYSFNEVINVDEEYDKLKLRGVDFIQKPKTQDWGQRTAYFKDPEGNIWEIQKWV